MNNKFNILCMGVLICSICIAGNVEKIGEIAVINPLNKTRASECVSLKAENLKGFAAEELGVYDPAVKKLLVSQAVDVDCDGKADELVFQVALSASEKRVMWLVKRDAGASSEAVTFARYVPERADDFAWENDLIAFRMYGPALRAGAENSGVDCWLKRVDYPIINKWYANMHEKTYHTDWGEGYDPYHVGKTTGCGGLRVYENGQYLASNIYDKWKVITNGPIRSIFELTYDESWKSSGKDMVEVKRITIDAGQRLCRFESSFSGADAAGITTVAVGITTHNGKADAKSNLAAGLSYCSETIDGEYLGTAVILASAAERSVVITSLKADESQIYLHTDKLQDRQISYYTGFGWGRAGQITTQQQWKEYLENYVLLLQNPIRIEYL